jgi:putative ABC transport system permease protein
MYAMYRTLSARYLRRRWTRALLIVASIALGVATLVATRSLNDTMNKAVRSSANPLAGGADLMVSNGDLLLPRALGDKLAKIHGVRDVRSMVLAKVALPDLQGRSVLLVGSDKEKVQSDNPFDVKISANVLAAGRAFFHGQKLCFVGRELNEELTQKLQDPEAPFQIQVKGQAEAWWVGRGGIVDAQGAAAAYSGNILYMDTPDAIGILRRKGMVNRFDLILAPGHDREKVRQRVQTLIDREYSRATVKTPEENAQTSQNVMSGMQVGFALCGIGALVVGMFLVYNALSVSVTERRHEIGILRAVGATRLQVRALFAGEAALLGLAGAVVGVPLGLGLAYLALEPMRQVVSEVFRAMDANRIEWTVETLATAVGAGMVTALLASLVPAFRASAEEPAVAVRRIPQSPTWAYRFVQLAVSVVLMLLGVSLVLARARLPHRLGTYGGLMLVLVGALLATPLLAAVASRLVQPLARRFLGIEGRLAADNLVRAPARTGLVIAAVAAGVSLVMQTAGTIRSNREAFLDWAEKYIVADVVISAGSPVSAGQEKHMDPRLGAQFQDLWPRETPVLRALRAGTVGLGATPLAAGPGSLATALIAGRTEIRAVLPVRFRKYAFRDTEVFLIAMDARRFWEVDKGHQPEIPDLDLYLKMAQRPGSVIISDNFATKHGVKTGDTLVLAGVKLRVVGQVLDYSWGHGTLIMDWEDYARRFRDQDTLVDVFDIYLTPGADAEQVRDHIAKEFGATEGLVVQTRQQLWDHIAGVIEKVYAIAYGQQIIVGVVAALGVVTALLIAVLQRRRELGVLRAIGASRSQIVRSVLAEAALMGLIGTVIGLMVGVPFEWYILQVVMLEESGYALPVLIPWMESGVIAGLALLVATLAGLGPALHAVRLRIPEAIAHE